MSTFVRVVNNQLLPRSILIDKVDRSQGNFSHPVPYAQTAKQKVYVPYTNPLDSSVKGYIDMVPTDEVLLQLHESKGVLAKLASAGYVSTTLFHSALTVAPVITSAVHNSPSGKITIDGTTFASLAPDHTYVTLSNGTSSQVLADAQIIADSSSSFSTTAIVIHNALITIGTPAAGWTVNIQANSKKSNVFTVT